MKSSTLLGDAAPMPVAPFNNCFGCAPGNLKGLQLSFETEEGQVRASVCLGHDYESFPGIIHGGIIATILDEAMAREALRCWGVPAMTVGLRVRYVQVMRSGRAHVVKASIASGAGNPVAVRGELISEAGDLVAVADGTFFLWSSRLLVEAGAGLPEHTLQGINRYAEEISNK